MRHFALLFFLAISPSATASAQTVCKGGEKSVGIKTIVNFEKVWITASDLSTFDEYPVEATNNTSVCWSEASVVEVQTQGTNDWVTIKFNANGEQILTATK